MFWRSACLLSVVAGLGLVNAGPPQPPPHPTHVRGSPLANLRLEFFMDHMCSDCKQAAPVMDKLTNHYNTSINFIVHVFPLPYHHNAFITARAGEAVRVLGGEDAWWCFYQNAYNWQAEFSDLSSSSQTEDAMAAKLVSYASSQCGVDATKMAQLTTYGGDADEQSRIEFKFGALKGVFGTPCWFVNGVRVDQPTPDWTLQQWTDFLDPFV